MSSDFSRCLSLLRQEKGISQRAAAKELGISQALLSHYEKGVRECGLDFLVRAAAYYGVSCDYLLGRTPPEPGLDLTGLTEEQRAAVEVIVRGMRRQNDTDFPGK